MSGTVLVEKNDGIATVTLSNPGKRNAIDHAMAVALVRTCEELDADASVGAVLLCGAEGYFCSGGDRKLLAAAGERPAAPAEFAAMTDVYNSFRRVGDLRAPTIAAIRGGAVGAGLNLALATDLRIVAEDAVLMSGFMRIGLHPGGGNGHLLRQTAGSEAAAALTLFGERIDGVRAVQLGLAWEAPGDAEVESRARELAAIPAADPEVAWRTAKSLRAQGDKHARWDLALDYERSSQMWTMARKHH
ncbi:MAG: enoyl-CoA hydratase/isomerase family protein [Solirubrobacterales bacterium]|nr:enoyl-CoA hydratase/isomerase family protein [Solirubrobacterales bacterium]